MNIGGTEKAFLNMLDIIPQEEYEVTLLLLEKTGGYMSMLPEWLNVEGIEDYATMRSEIMDPPLKVAKDYLSKGKVLRAIGLSMTHLVFKLSEDRTLYYRYVLGKKERKEKYDVAIAYCGPFDFLTVYVLYFVNAISKVQWIHFDVSKFHFNTKMCRKLYPKFQKICVVSDEARENLVKLIPEIKGKTKTFLNVVSKEKCHELAKRGNGFSDKYDGIRIVTVGRLSEEKGQDIVPEVASRLKRDGLDCRWYLIGDGKLREKIEERAREFQVKDEIVFLGTQVNPYPFLKDADIYVQTSIHEGYCITLAEARAFDLPIVSTECAGAHEQLDNRDNSYVVKRDAESIYKAIISIER